MTNRIKVSVFLALNMFAFFILELKEVPWLETHNYIILYVLYHLLFVAGLCLYGFFQNGFIKICTNQILLTLFSFIYALSGVFTLISSHELVYLLSLGMAVFITGILSGAGYFSVFALVPKWWRGRVLAAGICGGILFQFVVESSKVLSNPNIYTYAYTAAFVIVAAIAWALLLEGDILRMDDDMPAKADTTLDSGSQKVLLIWLTAAVVIISYLSSLYEGVTSLVYTAYEQSIFNTRLLYGISVVMAGFIADLKGRRYLSLISFSVMTLLVLNVFLLKYPSIKTLNWMVLFLGAGFLAMFVTINFIDIAHLTSKPALWTGAGRIIKHSVCALGTVLGAYFWSSPDTGLLIIITQYLLLLIVLTFLLFKLYQMFIHEKADYSIPDLPAPDISPILEKELTVHNDDLLPDYLDIEAYQLTDREKQVLASIITRSTIKEIAAELYISERTVKFHIKNILTKTDTKNQKDLLAKLMLGTKTDGEKQLWQKNEASCFELEESP